LALFFLAPKGDLVAEVVEHPKPTTPAPSLRGPGQQLQTLLIDGESIRAMAVQHRLYALLHRRNVAAATTGRFVFMKRPLLGGYLPFDVRWQDLKDAHLTVGMFSATLKLSFTANLSDTATGEGQTTVVEATGLKIADAQALYRVCQAEEQAWREKRRVRSIEEMRAAAGGVQIATGVYPPASSEPVLERLGSTPPDDPAQRLAKARKMLQDGLITDAEFEAIKARIVAAL
jgi:hypothetical protein